MVQTAYGTVGHSGRRGNKNLSSVLENIEVEISVELGAATMPIHHLLRMGRGAVIELDSTENDPLCIYANKTLIARGEVKIEDGQLLMEVTSKALKPV
ncbi:MAG: flagellar motor switch protein FliN [Alphaproteobacteria bacterium]|nr:flagellar motor switch protein FliN [Alphaproteobacteria bacterium]